MTYKYKMNTYLFVCLETKEAWLKKGTVTFTVVAVVDECPYRWCPYINSHCHSHKLDTRSEWQVTEKNLHIQISNAPKSSLTTMQFTYVKKQVHTLDFQVLARTYVCIHKSKRHRSINCQRQHSVALLVVGSRSAIDFDG